MSDPFSSRPGLRPPRDRPQPPFSDRSPMPPQGQPPLGAPDYSTQPISANRLAPSYQGSSWRPPNDGRDPFDRAAPPTFNNMGAFGSQAAAAIAAAQHGLSGPGPPQTHTPEPRFYTHGGHQYPLDMNPYGLMPPGTSQPNNPLGWGTAEGVPRREGPAPNSVGSEPSVSRPGTSSSMRAPRLPIQSAVGDHEARDDGPLPPSNIPAGHLGPHPGDNEEKIDHRKRKRNRTIRSCVPCHNHKRRCDRKRPCGRCTALGLTGSCVYEVDEARDLNDPDVIETDRLRRRIAELEQVVRELRQRHPTRNGGTGTAATATAAGPSALPLDITHKVEHGVAGTSSNSEASPTASTTSQFGRRDHYSEPYSTHALPGEEMVSDGTGRKTFLGATTGKPIFRRLREVMSGRNTHVPDELMSFNESTAFKAWFPNMQRNTFPFTTIWSHENFIDEIMGLLPTAEEAEPLLESFVNEICVVFQAWHQPTLVADFRNFFALSPVEKRQEPLANLALYVMICSLGSMIRASAGEIFGVAQGSNADSPVVSIISSNLGKDHTSTRLQSELYLSAAFQALRLCSFLSSPTLATIQAEFLVCLYLLHSERAADTWAFTGTLVQQCIAMGLHVDPTTLDPKISMRDAEVRRRIWWSVAGFDALLCVSFGRPSIITYWTCGLPQDRPDDLLSEEPDSALAFSSTTNALSSESTEETYHAAHFQLTIPSLELLSRVFYVDPRASRQSVMGWFHSRNDSSGMSVRSNTYEDAIRLARDVLDWYSHIPSKLHHDVDAPVEEYVQNRTKVQVNQTLALVMKTFMLVLILHRPYLRADPTEYPESSELCLHSARMLLSAFSVMAYTQSSIVWGWWTVTYRAFHAGTICAFMAIREPGTPASEQCLADLHNVIQILHAQNRKHNWNVAHPVQGDLCAGLRNLEKLAVAATQQQQHRDSTGSNSSTGHQPSPMPIFPGLSIDPQLRFMQQVPEAPLSATRRRNNNPTPPPMPHRRTSEVPFLPSWDVQQPEPALSTGYGSNSQHFELPQIWASMFNIKMDPEASTLSNVSPIMPTATPGLVGPSAPHVGPP